MPQSDNATFEESLEQFRQFLANNHYPRNIVWLTADDIIITSRGVRYVRVVLPTQRECTVRRSFEAGLVQQRGVVFEAVCEEDAVTFCRAWSPRNRAEAQQLLVGTGLRLSVPTDSSKAPGRSVKSRLLWWFLKLKYARNKSLRKRLFNLVVT
jgi:hypothetical protein